MFVRMRLQEWTDAFQMGSTAVDLYPASQYLIVGLIVRALSRKGV